MESPAMRDDSVDKLLSVCIFHLPPTPAGALSLVGEFFFFLKQTKFLLRTTGDL